MRWVRSDTAKIVLAVFLIFALLEQIVRIFDLRTRLSAAPAAVSEANYSLRDIHGEDWQDYIVVGREQTTSAIYSPFIEYISGPIDGAFVTVTDAGLRCHDAAKSACSISGGAGEVWVFGGSTTFGYGVKNNETIPAYLNQMLPAYNVLNFGVASYYSTIERIAFLNLLTHFDPPAAVVFIDGLNDFYYHRIPDESMVSDELRNTFELPDAARTLSKLNTLAQKSELISLIFDMAGDKADKTPILLRSDEALGRIIERLERNIAMRTAVANGFGTRIVNVLQPVPLYGPGHATSYVPAEFLHFKDHVNSGRGYELIHERPTLLSNPTVLNLAELGATGQMYVDTVHYHPEFNRLIAERIFQKLQLD
ncbi:SGNH/GDSL hydrolase family protein [Roseovarius pelagicus]|uniref:SGNH/GDSL hydrolase family protein n=1 Tax=Roseovarius pelagicus TaxID=2980108 RepID=A0ABY6DC17_9RHOB|nr:SGNH/GDSL hydrolase family protein [Roseovarius pelagicus]UXX83686.1 SGNH/GDSL hydrolase family protein [Roseovarius pelagicus]